MSRLRLMRAPQKYVQGKDSLLKFHEEMQFLGTKWLFICSHSGHNMCHDKIEQSFAGTQDTRRYEIFGGISSVGEIEKMRKIVKEDGIQVVVGVGGGSAIDTAKATAYYEHLPVAIIPTVVATDAPCTGLSVIYNDDKTFNSYLFYPKNPEAVIVDSDVIAKAPVRFLVAGMGDALGTYFEARACERTDAPSLEFGGITRSALALCKLCYETLKEYGPAAKTACEKQIVTPALEAVIEANVYLSGVGADNGGLAVAHSFYNGLTALGGHSAPHGCCVAFGTLVQLVLENAPTAEFNEVQGFCRSVGLPVTLEEIGITTDEQIQTIAEKSCVEGESIHNMVGDVTPEQLYAAIVAADALGKKA
ncbi:MULTISPECIES: glycerol dehydrogenase [Caproicibacterium]|uniref:Glycerol dehydrogenase n=1 Tax=Caproicibacterium argilliputei TaxID=3030016 RepID=A0AA97H1G7_9FIRM|nr:glycerol dehydrogenase [Caproicibacterium argilliputei]WOC32551.1 glycerol dehydrogenase [Caproicibacterium argilliputei]